MGIRTRLGRLPARLNLTGDFLKGTGTVFKFDFLSGGSTGTYVLVDWNGATTFSAADFSFSNLAGGLTGVFAINGTQLEFTATASAIPEPATTVALIGAAVLGFAVYSRRRRETASVK